MYLVLGTAYSVLVPVFEAPDEPAHLGYLNALMTTHRLPTRDATPQAHQPPAYYALLAAVLHRRFHDAVEVELPPNREFRWTGPDRNRFLHPARPLFSQGPRRVWFHQLRSLQLILGAIPVLFAWKLARLMAPQDPRVAWLAGMLAAGIPQFLFVSASLSNANLTNALSAAALFCIVRLQQEEQPAFGRTAGLGALVGVSLLGKLTAAFLLPTWLIACALARVPRRQKILRAAIGMGVALLVSGWFYAWNVVRFGNPVGEQIVFRPEALPKVFHFGYWYFLFRSFWGRFGWLNVKAPLAVYAFFSLLSLAALAGLVILARNRRQWEFPRGVWVAAAAVLFALLPIPPFSLAYDPFFQPQGRYLFPALCAITFLMALGLLGAFRKVRLEPVPVWAIPPGIVIANLLILVFSIYPAYYT